MKYQDRATLCEHPMGKKLFKLMASKKSNLALSADLTKAQDILDLADAVGPDIVVLKTHIDIVEDFSMGFVEKLKTLAEKHQFLIFEDRKFADIGNTVMHQFKHGVYQISSWVDIINAHLLPGPGIIDGLKAGRVSQEVGLLLIAQMSSKDNYLTPKYVKETVSHALKNSDFVMGFIAQEKLVDDLGMIHMTPGVKLESGVDALGQQYLTPEYVICEQGSDVIIVGRGIYGQDKPGKYSNLYREKGWAAYLSKITD